MTSQHSGLFRGQSVAAHIRSSMDQLTPAERRAARTILADYPSIGLGTVLEIANRANVGSATVARLIQKLGYESYDDFQASLRQELSIRATGPVERLGSIHEPLAHSSDLAHISKALGQIVLDLPLTIPSSEYEAAVSLLADTSRRIALQGGRVSHLVAAYMQIHLARIRPLVSLVDRLEVTEYASLLDVNRKDVYVLLDFRRYDPHTEEVARTVKQRGATVVLITDVYLAPAAAFADIVLPVVVETPTLFDTSLASQALADALIASTVARLGDTAVERLREWDRVVESHRGFQ